VLKNVKKIEIQKQEDSHNFTIVFHFEPNEYFSNTLLKKTFTMKDEENPVKSEGTIIDWKEGKNVTKKTVKKKQKNKKSGAQRVVTKEVDDDSFFNFFKSIDLEDEAALEKMEEEESYKLEDRMNIDYEIAMVVIDELVPYSLEYFLGVKHEDEDYEGGDNEDDHDHDTDDDDEEEAPKPKSKKAHKKSKDSTDKGGDQAK